MDGSSSGGSKWRDGGEGAAVQEVPADWKSAVKVIRPAAATWVKLLVTAGYWMEG